MKHRDEEAPEFSNQQARSESEAYYFPIKINE
jgi:hypothetical protein